MNAPNSNQMQYAPPMESKSDEATPFVWVRIAVWSHLVAVAICLAVTLADRGLLFNANVSKMFTDYCAALMLPSLLAWFICPIMVLTELSKSSIPISTRAFSVMAEVALCVAQGCVLLPAAM